VNTLLYWVAIPMLANILLILFVVVSLRRLARRLEEDAVAGAVERVLATLTPLVAQARELSQTFDAQLREKQRLIQTLNESLDRRATALTLLVNRTEATLKSGENQRLTPESLDLQEAVLDLAAQGKDTDRIARQLAVSPGEVSLILELKRKLDALSAGGR
jgi:DNA-binding NarL/FixJ family response regulator